MIQKVHLAVIVSALLGSGLGGCATLDLPDGTEIADHPLVHYHRIFRPGKPWRLTANGVEVKRAGVLRTPGKPLSADAIWRDFHGEIGRWADHYKVPAELIIAVIAIEAHRKGTTWSRDPRSVRTEKGYTSDEATPGRVSVGLMQVTLATARAVMSKEGGNPEHVTRKWLMVPDNAIRIGTAYLSLQARGKMCNGATLLDPPVALAAYNTGHIARMGGRTNPWKLKQHPKGSGKHVTSGVSFFNDAVNILQRHSIPAPYDYYDYLVDLEDWRP